MSRLLKSHAPTLVGYIAGLCAMAAWVFQEGTSDVQFSPSTPSASLSLNTFTSNTLPSPRTASFAPEKAVFPDVSLPPSHQSLAKAKTPDSSEWQPNPQLAPRSSSRSSGTPRSGAVPNPSAEVRRTTLIRRLAEQAVSQSQRTPQFSRNASQAELRERANVVAREAERRLAGIQEVVDLSPTQEDVLFGIYAGASPAYDPRMSVAAPSLGANAVLFPSATQARTSPAPNATGANSVSSTTPISSSGSTTSDPGPQLIADADDSPTPSPLAPSPLAASATETDQQVLAVLEPEQQAALLEDWESEDALWGFIVDDLNEELDEAVDAALDLLDESIAEDPVQETPVDGPYLGQDLELFRP